ncbi:MFS transporter [Piscinibacter sp.]|uniref:MFS transporter n=1 Tax=Piscinibacter sp. TaxID=1903157 RepID=UPI00391F2CD3
MNSLSNLFSLHTLIGLHLVIKTSQAAVAFAVSYWVYVTTDSASASAMALFARLAPSILLSLYSGWISDSRSPTRLYSSALLGQCGCSAALATYLALSNSEVWVLLVLIAASSVVDSFTHAGYLRLALRAIRSDDPNKSVLNGRVSLPDSSAPLVGPVLAAVGLQFGGLPAVFAADAAICVAAAVFLLSGPARSLPGGTGAVGIAVSPWAGFEAIWRNPRLRSLQLLFSTQNVCV